MSVSGQYTAACFLAAVKELLKQRGVTYCDLAQALGCSLPTIKRSLNKTSLPLDRLLEVAEVADIDFSEICKLAEKLRPRHYIFTAEQDAMFAERPELLVYLRELMDGKTADEIARQFNLDINSTKLYHKHLARVGLIKKTSRRQVTLLVSPPVGFGSGSLYLQKTMERFLTSLITGVVHDNGSQPDRFAILKPLTLTNEEYNALIDGAKRLVDQYSAIGERRSAIGHASHWQIAIACGPGPTPESTQLPRIID